jgi:hypothetical protein
MKDGDSDKKKTDEKPLPGPHNNTPLYRCMASVRGQDTMHDEERNSGCMI